MFLLKQTSAGAMQCLKAIVKLQIPTPILKIRMDLRFFFESRTSAINLKIKYQKHNQFETYLKNVKSFPK